MEKRRDPSPAVPPLPAFLDRGRRLCRSTRPLVAGLAAGALLAFAAILLAA